MQVGDEYEYDSKTLGTRRLRITHIFDDSVYYQNAMELGGVKGWTPSYPMPKDKFIAGLSQCVKVEPIRDCL